MMSESKQFRWKPVELIGWSRVAFGRNVSFISEGGTLTTSIRGTYSNTSLYLRATIEGRMLVEVYANGKQIYDELIAHDELDCFVKVPNTGLDIETELEVHFIPATTGEVRISRSFELVTTDNPVERTISAKSEVLGVPA